MENHYCKYWGFFYPPVQNFAKIRVRGTRGLLGFDHRDLRAPFPQVEQSAKADRTTRTSPWRSAKAAAGLLQSKVEKRNQGAAATLTTG